MIRFREAVDVVFESEVCCFSGSVFTEDRTLRAGDVLCVSGISQSGGGKVKTRPGVRPSLELTIDLGATEDRRFRIVSGVPDGSFEVVDCGSEAG